MFKRLFAIMILSSMTFIPAVAEDAVFSNNETEHFNLQPLEYKTEVKPIEQEAKAEAIQKTDVKPAETLNTDVSNQNYVGALNNLDNAQVQIREQMSAYSALMAQAKTNYEAKKSEYNGYKKQYNQLRKNMRSIEKSKKLIQNNINVSNRQN